MSKFLTHNFLFKCQHILENFDLLKLSLEINIITFHFSNLSWNILSYFNDSNKLITLLDIAIDLKGKKIKAYFELSDILRSSFRILLNPVSSRGIFVLTRK